MPQDESEQDESELDVKQMVDHYLETGQITYTEYQRLANAILADETIDEEERNCIDRLFKAVKLGRLRVIN